MPRRLALAVAPLVLLVLVLGACAESTRLPPAEPSASVEPLFASDEEALAAAFRTYDRYIAVTSTLSGSVDADTSLLAEVAVAGHVLDLEESIDELRTQGFTTQGQAEIGSIALQQRFEVPSGDVTVVAYLCLDVSEVRVVDSAGRDQTPADRPNLVGLEVVFWAINELDPELRVASSKQWTGSNLCDG